MSSAICFNLDHSKILSSGNGLTGSIYCLVPGIPTTTTTQQPTTTTDMLTTSAAALTGSTGKTVKS